MLGDKEMRWESAATAITVSLVKASQVGMLIALRSVKVSWAIGGDGGISAREQQILACFAVAGRQGFSQYPKEGTFILSFCEKRKDEE